MVDARFTGARRALETARMKDKLHKYVARLEDPTKQVKIITDIPLVRWQLTLAIFYFPVRVRAFSKMVAIN